MQMLTIITSNISFPLFSFLLLVSQFCMLHCQLPGNFKYLMCPRNIIDFVLFFPCAKYGSDYFCMVYTSELKLGVF